MSRPKRRGLPHISDHALLRWLERVHGIEIEWMRNHLAEEIKPYAGAGLSRLKKDGAIFCFKGDTLTTIIAEPKP